MKDRDIVAELLAEIAAKGVTQRQVAEAAGMTADALNKALRGTRRLQLGEAARIRAFLASVRPAADRPRALPPGFSDGDVAPWAAPAASSTPPPAPVTWEVLRHMPGLLLQAGDVLHVDPAARPVAGDFVLVTVPDDDGSGTVTILRWMAPGWFVSDDWRNLDAELPGALQGVVREVTRRVKPAG